MKTHFAVFLLLLFLCHKVVSQSLEKQEISVLLKLKAHWGDLPYMSNWTNSNADSHCNWAGITCDSGSVSELNLVNVDIVNQVPDFLCELRNLTVINIGNNYVPGEFPRSLYNCSKLRSLDISDNYFVGKLPGDIHRLAGLRSLVLAGNNFTGDFPAAIGKLKELRVLNLGANLFNGSLSPEIGELTNLEVLILSNIHNLLPSEIPLSYVKLKRLRVLYGYESNLFGEIPEGFGDLESIEKLDLSINDLTGKIPDNLLSMKKNLSVVYLYQNRLSGEIPRPIGSPSLTVVDLSMNNLTGEIPEGFGNLTEMTGLALFKNRLTGKIPEGIGRLPYLQDLNLWDNRLSGELPQDLGKNSKIRILQVSYNSFTGNLPESLCLNGSLVGLVANDNGFTGEIPKLLGENCSQLLIARVANNQLSGPIPAGLWTAPSLTNLMLSNNAFTGSIPTNVAVNLSRIELGDNRFSGEIPSTISGWKSLVVLKASNNLLTGKIPLELTDLPHLTNLLLDRNRMLGHLPSEIKSWKSLNTLNLSRNQLSGPIPDKLGLLPALTDLDLSNNLFSGEIPAKLGLLKLNYLNLSSNNLDGTIPREFESYDESFLNNPLLCAGNAHLSLRSCGTEKRENEKIKTPYLILIVTLSVMAFLLAASFSVFVIRYYWAKHGLDTSWRLTSFQKLNFRESNILSGLTENNFVGSGGSGKVYRVPVSRGADAVAVKRIVNNRRLEDKLEQEFLTEVKILSSIRHANIVKLVCCLSSESSKLLVYEYLENRSLDRWLHGKSFPAAAVVGGSRRGTVQEGVLDWPKRLRIAVGSAQGLSYMHHDCVPPVIHRDIKSSNILLDSEFNAKIADFGLAKLLARQGDLATMSTVAGSFGYMAPEYAHTTRVNEKIDVYSFGVVLLELATGRVANNGDEHTSLADWAWRHVQDGKEIEEALDDEVKEPSFVEEMSWVFKVGIICTSTLPTSRPTMKDVVQLLLRCFRRSGNKFAGLEYDAAPLLTTSKSDRVSEDDDDDDDDDDADAFHSNV